MNVQNAVQEIRPGMVILTNSQVGESQCNGRVENAIRRIQEKARVLRHQLENGIKCEVLDDAPIMSWLVKWAVELLSKHAAADDGRTPYERIRQEACAVPIAPFGETAMYRPLTIVKRSKGEPVKRIGVYLGTNERTEEPFIGTTKGVVKCRSMDRLTEAERWNQEAVIGMKGTIWEPVPGSDSQHVPVSIDDTGVAQDEDDDKQPNETIDDEVPGDGPHKFNYDKLHVLQKAIRKYGPSPGCPACGVITRRGPASGRLGYNHSATCRSRVTQMMRDDLGYRNLVQKQERQQEEYHVEVVTRDQAGETRGRTKKTVHRSQQKIAQEHGNVENRLNLTMMQMLIDKIEVAELYSPARVTQVARRLGFRAGWSLDITTCDSDGKAWDFNNPEMRNRAARKVLSDEHLLLIGSPMCIAFSVMIWINDIKMCK